MPLAVDVLFLHFFFLFFIRLNFLLFSGTISVYMGVYDHEGAFLAGPTSVRVPYSVSMGDIQDKAQTRFPAKLKDVDVGDIRVYQLKGDTKLTAGLCIILTEMATLLTCESDIPAGAHLACVIPG